MNATQQEVSSVDGHADRVFIRKWVTMGILLFLSVYLFALLASLIELLPAGSGWCAVLPKANGTFATLLSPTVTLFGVIVLLYQLRIARHQLGELVVTNRVQALHIAHQAYIDKIESALNADAIQKDQGNLAKVRDRIIALAEALASEQGAESDLAKRKAQSDSGVRTPATPPAGTPAPEQSQLAG